MTNVILILSDSLNRHHLPAYGSSPVPTPNLDRLLRRGHRFDNHRVGSLPCIPARRELFTGRQEFLWRPWGSIEPYDHRLPRLLENAGLTTAITTDHYHYWEEPGNGYLQSFQSAELVRGHEVDFWRPPIDDADTVPEWVRSIERWRPRGARQYYANVCDFETEEDFFTAKTIKAAQGWLTRNEDRRPFYLQVELFDVHEPFHVPEPYRSMFWDGGSGEEYTIWPPYQDAALEAEFVAQASEGELRFIRSQYAGKVAMLDHWLGRLFDTLDDQNLWDDTVVIFTTDHGHDLAERGHFAKQYPHYDSHANIPLIIAHPNHPGNGAGIPGLTCTVDMFATILDAAGAEVPVGTNSRSALPLLRNPQATTREAVLYGSFGQGVCYANEDWTLFKSPEADSTQLYYYSAAIYRSLHLDGVVPPDDAGYYIPGVEIPQWRVPLTVSPRERRNMLFHRADDPGQTVNRWDDAPHARAEIVDALRSSLAAEGCPPEQYRRLGLGDAPTERRVRAGSIRQVS